VEEPDRVTSGASAEPEAPGTPTSLERATRRAAGLRVAVLVVAGVALFVAATTSGVFPSSESIRGWIAPWGPLAPLLFVVLSVLLSSTFVPGPVLAGAAGLLFGTVAGLPLSVTAAVCAAVTQMLLGRHIARRQVEALLPEGARRYDELLERRGFLAVVWLRLVPGLPDTPVNYAAGLTRVKVWHIAAGTLVGGFPRAFAYVSLGGSFDDLGSTEARVAIVVLVVTGLVGLFLSRRPLKAGLRGRRNRDLPSAP